MDYKFADRMQNVKASEIRELLKVTEKPEVISFAGGLPAPELFPVNEILCATQHVLQEDGAAALQYTTTEGYLPLRSWIAERMNKKYGINLSADEVIITNGSQQAIDLTGKVFLNEGDTVFCESPTYLAAISALRSYSCRFTEVPTDDEGMLPDELENRIKTADKPKLIYIIPNFQNPTGRSWSLNRRKAVASLAAQYNLIVMEDDPYGELRFEGEPLPAVITFDQADCVFTFGTFSKILCPGFRIGWVAGSKKVIEKYVLVKQGTDLQCSTISQRVIAKYLELYDIDSHIEKMRLAYKARKDLAIKTMLSEFPEEVSFTNPQGGLFTWAVLPRYLDSRKILIKCLEKNIAFVPGGSFFPNGGHENTLRLNYSYIPEERIIEGLGCLGNIIKDNMNKYD